MNNTSECVFFFFGWRDLSVEVLVSHKKKKVKSVVWMSMYFYILMKYSMNVKLSIGYEHGK